MQSGIFAIGKQPANEVRPQDQAFYQFRASHSNAASPNITIHFRYNALI